MIKTLNAAIDRLEGAAMVVFMSIATIITAIQVVYRYGFNSSLFWAEEVVIYSIICMSFVGASMGVRYGAHISVDVLNAIVSPRINRWLHLVSAGLGIVFAAFMVLYGFELFINTLGRGQLTAALRLPMAWFYLPIGVSGVLLIIRYLKVIQDAWSHPPRRHADELADEANKLV
ncbi:TRAP transporter small permease [Halomonas cupida]|uniref:TRAP transporter small permease protein n=1 Tax=Halomonas cupida TaxID=44933 RepID=A0A1M7AY83_9GAMM|nr:TRAP transporter small permease [Halomonas cupida]GEN22214.1 C4-dicarboxylate ABC transporter substrate-binding protein [Halomonas cupida]SHL47671.1 Tripartite ATP-independent transporter, DctQ component [Halomonas cupida]